MANPPGGKKRAFSSARAILAIGSQKVGWAIGFRANPTVVGAPIFVFGDMYKQRTEPVTADGSGSFDFIHMLWQPLNSLKSGSASLWANHLLTTQQWIEYEPPPIGVYDLITGKGVCLVTGMFPEREDFSLTQGGLMQRSCNFSATKITEHRDEILR